MNSTMKKLCGFVTLLVIVSTTALSQVVLPFPGNRPLTEVLFPRTSGTNIGNMTSGGGLAAAFDGNSNQSNVQSALRPNAGPTGGFVGKNMGTPAPVSRVVAHSPNNVPGFTQSGTASLTLYASNSNPGTATSGTVLATLTAFTGVANTNYTLTSSDKATPYQYVWVWVSPTNAGNDAYMCEQSTYIMQ